MLGKSSTSDCCGLTRWYSASCVRVLSRFVETERWAQLHLGATALHNGISRQGNQNKDNRQNVESSDQVIGSRDEARCLETVVDFCPMIGLQ